MSFQSEYMPEDNCEKDICHILASFSVAGKVLDYFSFNFHFICILVTVIFAKAVELWKMKWVK